MANSLAGSIKPCTKHRWGGSHTHTEAVGGNTWIGLSRVKVEDKLREGAENTSVGPGRCPQVHYSHTQEAWLYYNQV